MENIEIVNDIDNNIINSIIFISSKSEYINLSENNLKQYIKDKYHKVIIVKDNNQVTGFLIYFLLEPEIDIIFIASYPKGYGGKTIIIFI
ncbi:hypothetical protein [Brachyspira hampsonii]|uniref:hypothetical protein n=1 Tax=Brachyspira hampsonii TaxID=1287055 RepID=UPI00034562B0|nr:hypothetical protein [Brachyspira hampsonii]